MNMSYDGAPAVRLESQTDLLKKLESLTADSSNMVMVEGKTGSGKSWLSQQFLNLHSNSNHHLYSFLICLPSQDTEQQRSVILGQLLSDSFCTGEEPLLESIEENLQDEEIKATIVVDRADLLAKNLLEEFCQLVSTAQGNPDWQISVILFTKPNSLYIDVIESKYTIPDIQTLAIPALTDDETELFMEQIVFPAAKVTNKKKQQTLYQAAEVIERTPGKLLSLVAGESHSVVCWVKRSLIALLVLLVLMGGWSWWTSYQARVEDQKADSQQRADNQDSSKVALDNAINRSVNSDESQVDSLPEAVTDKTLTVGDKAAVEDQERVVIPSKMVDDLVVEHAPTSDEMLDQTPPKNNAQAAPAEQWTIEESKPEPAKSESAAKTDPVKTEPAKTESTSTTTKADAPKASSPKTSSPKTTSTQSTFTLNDKELLAVSDSRYTLQLVASTTKAGVEKFIQTYDLAGKVRTYDTDRNGSTWYIVTYQDFADINQAREAVKGLSTELQKRQPWPKSLAQVHQEIQRAK
ncbi:MAG: AAA family ATPase [Vibrio sp.]